MTLEYRGVRQYVPLSPDRIRKQEFPRPKRGRRAYDQGEVDRFVARLAEDAEWYVDTITRLRNEVDRLTNWFRDQEVDTSAPQRLPQRIENEAIGLLSHAQRQADDLVADAQRRAHDLIGGARTQRDEIVAAAKQEAERAAQDYRRRSGSTYEAGAEETHRQIARLRVVDAALQGLAQQLPSIIQQVEAARGAFGWEIAALEQSTDQSPQQAPSTPPAQRQAADDLYQAGERRAG